LVLAQIAPQQFSQSRVIVDDKQFSSGRVHGVMIAGASTAQRLSGGALTTRNSLYHPIGPDGWIRL